MENESLRQRSVVSHQDEENSQIITPGVYYPKNRSPHRFHQKSSRRSDIAVLKNGEFNIVNPMPKKFRISSWFTIMVDAKWRWVFLIFFTAYTADWLFFGFIYWIIALVHGDLVKGHLPPNQNDTNWTPCIENIYGFTSSFLFSIEVHTTVAHGSRSITLECPEALFVMCIQCILSLIFQAFMLGFLFAKLTRPKARMQTILVSKHAVVNLRNDKMCLMFRVCDMRNLSILNIKASVFIIRMDDDAFMDNFMQIELKTEMDGCESTFSLWPVSVIHVVDEKSPLYRISAAHLMCEKIEMLVVFEGIVETTGQPVQARSSFTENNIRWGHRFVPMVDFDCSRNVFDVDFSKLNETEQIDTPLCSAGEYEDAVCSLHSFNLNEE